MDLAAVSHAPDKSATELKRSEQLDSFFVRLAHLVRWDNGLGIQASVKKGVGHFGCCLILVQTLS